jgi:hypothetical protein
MILEDYVESLDLLAQDMRHYFSHMRSLDLKVQSAPVHCVRGRGAHDPAGRLTAVPAADTREAVDRKYRRFFAGAAQQAPAERTKELKQLADVRVVPRRGGFRTPPVRGLLTLVRYAGLRQNI